MLGAHGIKMSEEEMNRQREGLSLSIRSSQLKHRVKQIATHEEEIGRNMEKCMATTTVGPTGRRIENTIESIADQSSP